MQGVYIFLTQKQHDYSSWYSFVFSKSLFIKCNDSESSFVTLLKGVSLLENLMFDTLLKRVSYMKLMYFLFS